jgi:hypothetical protein
MRIFSYQPQEGKTAATSTWWGNSLVETKKKLETPIHAFTEMGNTSMANQLKVPWEQRRR